MKTKALSLVTSLLFIFTFLLVPQASAQTKVVTCQDTDINQDGSVNLLDYSKIVINFLKPTFEARADVNGDGTVNITDYSFVVGNFLKTCPAASAVASPSSSPRVTPTPTPTPTPRVTPSPTPTPTPTPATSPQPSGLSYFWISPAEIMDRKMEGSTWTAMVSRANAPGSANVADQDSKHPESVLAMALVAIRTNNTAMKEAAANELVEAIGTEKNTDSYCDGVRATDKGGPAGARGLAVGRNMIGYVVAADLLNFKPGGYDPSGKGTRFYNWVKDMRVRQNCPDNGGGTYPTGNWFTISQTHEHSTSNGNALAGATRIAMAAYTGDKAEIDKAWLVFRRYAGDRSVGPNLPQNSYAETWIHDKSAPVGINPMGAKCNNGIYPADGVIVNDQGRNDAVCPTNVSTAPRYTQYPWEGLQGAYAQALIFDRLNYTDGNGNDAWRISNSAMKRAVEYQWYLQNKFGGEWYTAGRADWVKHLAFYIYGYKPAPYNPQGGERNMDWTQWTHQ